MSGHSWYVLYRVTGPRSSCHSVLVGLLFQSSKFSLATCQQCPQLILEPDSVGLWSLALLRPEFYIFHFMVPFLAFTEMAKTVFLCKKLNSFLSPK